MAAARHRKPIITLAARHRLPAVYVLSNFVVDGGLLSYGPDIADQYRVSARYVDRVLKGERPTKKAAVAVVASILTTYHMLADGTCYQDLGPDHFARHNPAATAANLANLIRNLGFHVEIRPAA